MDDDTADLIAQLCTRIGVIMEDASPVAIGICAMSEVEREAAIAEIAAAAARISAIVQAVDILSSSSALRLNSAVPRVGTRDRKQPLKF